MDRLARLALPLTTGQQGGLVTDGIPAVSIDSTGERTGDGNSSSTPRLAPFGRAALRAAGLLDSAPDSWPGSNNYSLPLRGRELPQWVVRLLAAAAIAAALAAGVDGLARARRARVPVLPAAAWLLACWPAFLLAWWWLALAGMSGMIAGVPLSTAPPGTVAIGWPVTLGAPIAAAIGWIGLRPMILRRTGVDREPGVAAPSVLMISSALVAAAVWLWSPLTALLLVPFIHVAPWVCDPERSPGRRISVSLLALTAVPLIACVTALGFALGAGPIALAKIFALLFAGGSIGIAGALCATLAAALYCGALVLALRARRAPQSLIVTRGPVSYAGPGSLGGTGSAMSTRQGAFRD
jgi:hypothetical protein